MKFAFRGHDMHGLVIGPDGRLYFSIGDRGLNVKTREGRHLYNPDSGAVLRCELDRSNLEIFCTGVRNPQELAFDDLGNLFTVDNNSDSGDKARLYHLVQGGDYGWRMYYQYLPDRGPWNREMLWGLPDKNQSYSVIPPIAHITDGPSGLVAYPGTGLGDDFQGSFFVCDFRGGPANGAVRRFTMEPDGATFKLGKYEPFFERILATDCDFGPDGAFYVSDWVDGWDGIGKGRIYRVTNDATTADARVKEVQTLLKDGFDQRPVAELTKLLGHADRRVRMGAQFALVEKKAIKPLAGVAVAGTSTIQRFHAVQGLGMIARLTNADPQSEALKVLLQVSGTDDHEIAGQALIALSQTNAGRALIDQKHLKRLLSGDAHGAVLAASCGVAVSDATFYDELIAKHETSPILRTLLAANRASAVKSDGRPAEWSGMSLTTRRARSAFELAPVAQALADADPVVVLNAAIRISDYTDEQPLRHIAGGYDARKIDVAPLLKQLAALISKPYPGNKEQSDALFRRILNANYRLGQGENAAALAVYAGRSDVPEKLRIEALDMLLHWAEPSSIDRVTGQWRPLERRSAEPAKTALSAHIGPIFAGPDKVRTKAAKAAGKLGLKDIQPLLLGMLRNGAKPVEGRAAAFYALGEVAPKNLSILIDEFKGDKAPELRIAAATLFAKIKPQDAPKYLDDVLNGSKSLGERQAAFKLLEGLKSTDADRVLNVWMSKLAEKTVPDELRLDLTAAVKTRTTDKQNSDARPDLIKSWKTYSNEKFDDEKLKPWRESFVGGDAERGKTIFHEKIAVSCVRCHRIGETGGEVGPNLSHIGKDKTRQYLLEAIVDPNRAVTQGFETVVLELESGQVVTGIIKKETPDEITLIDANAKTLTVKTAEVESRQKGLSSMPSDVSKELTPFEVRDLVEFLQGLK
ncbi:MAG: PQQ-dependent sugar dehydrogenase [Pirellulales bacterium]